MSRLFTPLTLGGLEIPNRIVVSPMCQYSARDGAMNDWHLQHVMNLAMSGAGLVVIEATATERRGRITHGCVGLYDDQCEAALARVMDAARRVALPGTRFALQLAHAGRKASAERPWEGGGPLQPAQDPWPVVGASPVAFGPGWPVPQELTAADIEALIAGTVAAAHRAVRLGFDAVELHMAHGYLLHSFHSPVANHRSDAFGGTPQKRRALPVAMAEAVRRALPAAMPLGARITGSDWLEGGLTPDDAVALAGDLKAVGVDYACVSSGGIAPEARIRVAPGYQLPFARAVKAATGITTRAVGLIVTPGDAESALADDAADCVALGRAFLDDPRWGWHAADALGASLTRPSPYARTAPKLWPGAAQKA